MTGPEHYLEAERLLRSDRAAIALAQVHATLALAAATAVAPMMSMMLNGDLDSDYESRTVARNTGVAAGRWIPVIS